MRSLLKCAVLLSFKIKTQKQNIVNIKAIFSFLFTLGRILLAIVIDDTYAFS
jgi:hypothetical protein